MKIRYKIFLMILSLLIPSLVLLAVAIPVGIEKSMMVDAENKLQDAKKVTEIIISQNLKSYKEDELKKVSMDIVNELGNMLNLRVSIYNSTIMLADSSNLFEEMPTEASIALKGETNYRRTRDNIYFAFPLKDIGAVRIIYPLDMINEITDQAKSLITVLGLSILALSVIGAGILARRFSRPITDLNNQAKRIKDGEYNLKVQSKSHDEIGELTQSFIEMSGEVKNRINQLELMVERERQLKDLQRNFLNSVTHEFKTPLTSIIGYADLLKQYKDDPALLEDAVRIIRAEGERLYQMVEKVLYLSRVGKFDFSLEIGEFNVQELINKSIEGVSIRARNQDVSIHRNINYQGVMSGDFEMLYRMFVNLLDNAIKYNREGGEVSLDVTRQDAWIRIFVRDTGIGIGREHVERIFEPFYREDKNRSRKIGGDGLGLSIVKEIVEKHGGRISISSEKNKGTEVTVLLPA